MHSPDLNLSSSNSILKRQARAETEEANHPNDARHLAPIKQQQQQRRQQQQLTIELSDCELSLASAQLLVLFGWLAVELGGGGDDGDKLAPIEPLFGWLATELRATRDDERDFSAFAQSLRFEKVSLSWLSSSFSIQFGSVQLSSFQFGLAHKLNRYFGSWRRRRPTKAGWLASLIIMIVTVFVQVAISVPSSAARVDSRGELPPMQSQWKTLTSWSQQLTVGSKRNETKRDAKLEE